MNTRYRAICIDQRRTVVEGDDLFFKFILVDENDDIITDLSSWEFNAELYNTVDEIDLEWGTDVSVSNEVITVHITDSDSEDLSETDHQLEFTGEKGGYKYTLWRGTIYIKEDIEDWS